MRFAATKLLQPLGDGSYVIIDESSGNEIVLTKDELGKMWNGYVQLENQARRETT